MLMSVSLIDCIGLLLAVFSAGIAVGRFVEKINRHISDSKKDLPSAKRILRNVSEMGRLRMMKGTLHHRRFPLLYADILQIVLAKLYSDHIEAKICGC